MNILIPICMMCHDASMCHCPKLQVWLDYSDPVRMIEELENSPLGMADQSEQAG